MITNFHEEMTESQKELFFQKIEVTGDGCYLWTGTQTHHGYGVVQINGRRYIASRVAWSLYNKRDVGSKMYCSHHCDTPLCVRGSHLFLSNGNKENMADAAKKGRTARGTGRPEAKLNEDIVYFARSIYQRGLMNGVQIAAWFGIHWVTCYDMLNGKNWKHVPMPPPLTTEEG